MLESNLLGPTSTETCGQPYNIRSSSNSSNSTWGRPSRSSASSIFGEDARVLRIKPNMTTVYWCIPVFKGRLMLETNNMWNRPWGGPGAPALGFPPCRRRAGCRPRAPAQFLLARRRVEIGSGIEDKWREVVRFWRPQITRGSVEARRVTVARAPPAQCLHAAESSDVVAFSGPS